MKEEHLGSGLFESRSNVQTGEQDDENDAM